MDDLRKRLLAITVLAALSSGARAQETAAAGPFKSVHLMIVTPVQESFLVAAVSDYNHEFLEQGCSSCVYRVFRMMVGKANKYNYMMTGDWPSQEIYKAIHSSGQFDAVTAKNPIMTELEKTEFYGRYTEVK